ncbi:hypothetical protein RESH_01486 [Rhodopirellula europaea SH398]|uniref:Uncharacterized protein n=1 Tax=Rhodopirellula europaea SH398 TaxID=1263868 RepID=M5S8V9_9BACT|nr:hypothetical protein RESH_01486 [Rhodopirellula europaea SH398]
MLSRMCSLLMAHADCPESPCKIRQRQTLSPSSDRRRELACIIGDETFDPPIEWQIRL